LSLIPKMLPRFMAFSLRDASGRAVRLADYRGKVLLLNFWATDCGGCRLEIPWLAEIDQAYKSKRVAVAGISMDISYEDLKGAAEAWARVKPFIQAHQISYPILMGDTDVTKPYDIHALPVTYLIDSSGRIAATYIGLIDKQNVEANINALLTERQ
jgi:peroxiredoxin